MAKLGVNIDHVATVRQARKTYEPDPVWAAAEAELGGADQITVHLREDRRHIQDRDVEILMRTVQTRVNLEMAVSDEILAIALRLKPHCVCLVPENRAEVTTEGGLDVVGNLKRIKETVEKLNDANIVVSLFVDPTGDQIRASAETGTTFIELHTGRYANACDSARNVPVQGESRIVEELEYLQLACTEAPKLGLRVNAGHGLNYRNVQPVAALPNIEELNIGHAIIARAIFTGLREAVREMKALLK
ncbi:MAG TPA: pyridoxine 5'-phosphate synthase [Planctomycetota bacterium]|nr:pyridoxine 5'-phosphate synthase [Planctomycetota bacterium]